MNKKRIMSLAAFLLSISAAWADVVSLDHREADPGDMLKVLEPEPVIPPGLLPIFLLLLAATTIILQIVNNIKNMKNKEAHKRFRKKWEIRLFSAICGVGFSAIIFYSCIFMPFGWPSSSVSLIYSFDMMITTVLLLLILNRIINRKNKEAQEQFWKKYNIPLTVFVCTVGCITLFYFVLGIPSEILCKEHKWAENYINTRDVPIVSCSNCKETVQNTWCVYCRIPKTKYFKKKHKCFVDKKGSIVGYETWLNYFKKNFCEKCNSSYYRTHKCYFCKRHKGWFVEKHGCYYCETHKAWFDSPHKCKYCITCKKLHTGSDQEVYDGAYSRQGRHSLRVRDHNFASDRVNKWVNWKIGDDCQFECSLCNSTHTKDYQECDGIGRGTW